MVSPMAKLLRKDIVRRLRAVRAELGYQPSQLAALIGAARTTYANWEAEDPKKPNFPSEEAMMGLCDILPGLTMDYLYRGRLDGLPMQLAIRLASREMGIDPDAPGATGGAVVARLAGAARTKA